MGKENPLLRGASPRLVKVKKQKFPFARTPLGALRLRRCEGERSVMQNTMFCVTHLTPRATNRVWTRTKRGVDASEAKAFGFVSSYLTHKK